MTDRPSVDKKNTEKRDLLQKNVFFSLSNLHLALFFFIHHRHHHLHEKYLTENNKHSTEMFVNSDSISPPSSSSNSKSNLPPSSPSKSISSCLDASAPLEFEKFETFFRNESSTGFLFKTQRPLLFLISSYSFLVVKQWGGGKYSSLMGIVNPESNPNK